MTNALLLFCVTLQDPDWKKENFAGPVAEEIVRSTNGHIELVNILGSRRWTHATDVKCVAFRPDGKRALSAGDFGTIRLWDAESGRETASWSNPEEWVNCVAFTPDGKHALGWGADGTVWFLDLETRERVAAKASCAVSALSVSPDGRRVLLGVPMDVEVWDVGSRKKIATWKGHEHVVTCIAFSPDGRRALSGSFDKILKLWDTESPMHAV